MRHCTKYGCVKERERERQGYYVCVSVCVCFVASINIPHRVIFLSAFCVRFIPKWPGHTCRNYLTCVCESTSVTREREREIERASREVGAIQICPASTSASAATMNICNFISCKALPDCAGSMTRAHMNDIWQPRQWGKQSCRSCCTV